MIEVEMVFVTIMRFQLEKVKQYYTILGTEGFTINAGILKESLQLMKME
ncbi:hypothetical protein [Pontibacillus salipaludis]|uniref:Uncharacterized protein n=1 Tax=Pontibacillus salipaludis TaxID=1697394 RepID=A0ABQ1Q5E5_9BACI|nr:hypothetical protein [Pontibacillus salipaludis]GGD13342.1 hypothetical protein GCM10011389_21210 [Pontibacillus salipaludis]